jgi:hypothetical protein
LGANSLQNNLNGNFNTCIGVNTGSNITSAISNTFIGRYVGGSLNSNDNTAIGYFSLVTGSGSSNCLIGAYSGSNLTTGANNCSVGTYSNGITTGTNNTQIGNQTTASAGNFTNSTCIGYLSSITANSSIFLGTVNEITYPVGGLTINSGTVLKVLGSINANALNITPAQLSFLNQVTISNKIQSSTISDINNYLTVANASTTYQSKLVASSFITNTSTLSSPYYDYYCILTPNTTAITITLPTPSASLIGTSIIFRRINTIMAPINCSPSINGISNSSVTSLISAFQYQCEIACLFNSSTPTYNWFIIRQN